MRRRSLLAASGAAMLPAAPSHAEGAVDLLLVLAVDVSRSIDDDEARLQREGYRSALMDARVLEAIQSGMTGSIAIAYVEWAGSDYQRLVLPWTRIGSAQEAQAWADQLDRAPRTALSWTSISGGLDFSLRTLMESPFESVRRVVDVSGDGVNNSGPPVEQVRDRLVAEGITINGLPIMNDRPTFGRPSPVPLDHYFRDSVIGGAGAFLIAAEDFTAFGNAVRRKLVREIAGLPGQVIG
ncbi:DUF1194 domain-containing protein [Roseomonas xinghualingensis]|uniref:DUF1194 domain-containing protein n=1 Tax=Roseomonas xinghualingensis TaxID=2986475 RepID=UPI0021F171F6|nr:DUF1194 domain-containing protein [Roseomonas sp. SXEYE001]MCV4207807.1 DUF1194 domain-containing protein [Roseomonas sp. SXEYE001]